MPGESEIQRRRAERNREESRRRRRRRVAWWSSLVVLGSAVFAVTLVAGRGGEEAAGNSQAALTQAETRVPRADVVAPPPPPAPPPVSRRSRLGSGNPVTLAFAGDIHFETLRDRLGYSPGSILGPMAPTLKQADIAVVNLETAVTERGEPQAKAFTFRAPSSAFDALKLGGVDVASMANNHGMDFGMTGMTDSMAAARAHDFPVIGVGMNAARAYKPYRQTVHGQRIAIIAATQVLDNNLISAWSAGPGKPGLASAKDEPRLLAAVRAARPTSDTVVVFLHWGQELVGCPTGDQQSLARHLVAAGADVVVGSHAHILLGAGRMGDAFVDYGLGNFVFYASRELAVETGVLELTVTGRRVDDYSWVPGRISNSIPQPLSGAAADEALRSWNALRGCTGLAK